MLKRDRTGEEKQFDAKLKRGLMRLGENPSVTSSEVAEPLRSPHPFPHVLVWDRLGRKGMRCRLANPNRGLGDAVEVEFVDGLVAIVNRFAIRRID